MLGLIQHFDQPNQLMLAILDQCKWTHMFKMI